MAASAVHGNGGPEASAALPPLLAALAYAFLPAGSDGKGVVIEAPRTWSFDRGTVPADADVVIWGRLPDGGGGPRTLVRPAAARERAVRGALARRLPAHMEVCAVHRLGARGLTAGVRGGLRSALRGGVLVEIAHRDGVRRVLDAVAANADVSRLGARVYAGSGGTVLVHCVLVDGTAALLRVGRAGAPGDPSHVADELDRLASAAVPLAPRMLARGEAAGASWLAELALPGRRPARATKELTRQVAAACARFPRAEGPPTAVVEDLYGAAGMVPDRAGALRRLAGELAGPVRRLPAVLRHGDLWTGNLLVDRGRLTGLIDWDAAHPLGVPGADLLQLLATDARRRTRQSLGEAFKTRPWRSAGFRRATAGYWAQVEASPQSELLDVAGIAWWASEVHHTLLRLPHRAADEQWVTSNVDPVLANLGY